jgi:hypothetical protein
MGRGCRQRGSEHFRGIPRPGHESKLHYLSFPRGFRYSCELDLYTFANPPAAGFTALCPTSRACVPQNGVTSSNYLDGIGDRLMFRLAYRNFGDHESVVGNLQVSSGGVAGFAGLNCAM